MDKITKNIINKTIERFFYNMDSDFAKLLAKNTELAKQYEEYSNKSEELQAKLEEIVPEEYRDLVEKLVDANSCVSSIESQMYFKEGVCMGATELNYLGEVGMILNFI